MTVIPITPSAGAGFFAGKRKGGLVTVLAGSMVFTGQLVELWPDALVIEPAKGGAPRAIRLEAIRAVTPLRRGVGR